MKIPAKGANTEETKQCQCIERVVRISTTVMSFLQIGDSSELQMEDHSSRRLSEDQPGADEDEDGLERVDELESLLEEENVNDYNDVSNGAEPVAGEKFVTELEAEQESPPELVSGC